MPYQNKEARTKDKYPWVGQVRVNGLKKRKLCLTKRMASKWEEEEKEKASQEIQNFSTKTLLEWSKSYLSYSKERFVQKTYCEKDKAFRQFFLSVPSKTLVTELKPILVLEHLRKQSKTRSGNAANKDRKNLQAAWKWGSQYLCMPEENPFTRVLRFAAEKKGRYVPSLEDFWKVYAVANHGQDQLMLLTYLQTGARRDELFRLTWDDVDFENRRVRLRWRKNSIGQWKVTWLPIKNDLANSFLIQKETTGSMPFVFMDQRNPNPQKWKPFEFRNRWMPLLCRRAEVYPFGLHGIRHLFASILAEAGRPLVEIQTMLRHDSILTTQRYIHSLKKENREVLAALPDVEK